jgi:hypothetical protein
LGVLVADSVDEAMNANTGCYKSLWAFGNTKSDRTVALSHSSATYY